MSSRRRVYVIGAGFSAGLGFPLTAELLPLALSQMNDKERRSLTKIIEFHFPSFRVDDFGSYPNIEDLLTKIRVNIDLFPATRVQEGKFQLGHLVTAEREVLYRLVVLFHTILEEMGEPGWLSTFIDRVKRKQETIVSFNWDLVLDARLGDKPSKTLYGFGVRIKKAVRLLKPHGSLNWYQQDLARHFKSGKAIPLWEPREGERSFPSLWLFKYPRQPRTSVPSRQYVPWVVPPTHMKSFDHPFLQEVFRIALSRIGTAKEVVFLGYSMPPYDEHAEFLLRCAFHVQKDGEIVGPRKRSRPTGPATVIVVDPDAAVAERIQRVLGVKCIHHQMTVATWVRSGKIGS